MGAVLHLTDLCLLIMQEIAVVEIFWLKQMGRLRLDV